MLTIDGRPIQQVNSTRLLGVTLSQVAITQTKSLQKHRNVYISSSFSKEPALTLTISSTYTLQSSDRYWSTHAKHTSLTKKQTRQIEYIQRRAMRIIFHDKLYTEAITTANLPTLSDRREKLCRTLFISMQQSTHKLHHLLPPLRETPYTTRNTRTDCVPRCRTARFQNSFIPYALRHWQ